MSSSHAIDLRVRVDRRVDDDARAPCRVILLSIATRGRAVGRVKAELACERV